jgi:hypothetical protein
MTSSTGRLTLTCAGDNVRKGMAQLVFLRDRSTESNEYPVTR